MSVSPVQPENAAFPISVTPSGRVTRVTFTQSLKASSPMAVTPDGTSASPPLPVYFTSTPSSIVKSAAERAASPEFRASVTGIVTVAAFSPAPGSFSSVTAAEVSGSAARSASASTCAPHERNIAAVSATAIHFFNRILPIDLSEV